MDGGIRAASNLSALTVAMWIKSDDNQNQGTPFSYATSTQFNALTLTDYSGFVLYIDGEKFVTDINVNDGYWHHVTFTFNGDVVNGSESENGTEIARFWSIYVDGQRRASGTTARATQIEGGFDSVCSIFHSSTRRSGLCVIRPSVTFVIRRSHDFSNLSLESFITDVSRKSRLVNKGHPSRLHF